MVRYYTVRTIRGGYHIEGTQKEFRDPDTFYSSLGIKAEKLPLVIADYCTKDYLMWVEFKLDEEYSEGVAFFIVDERKKKV